MNTSDLDEKFLEIVSHNFGYLFDNDKYRIIQTDSSHLGHRQLIIVESSKCRMMFYSWQNEFDLHIGTHSSPIGWLGFQDENTSWFHIRAIHNFLAEMPVDIDKMLKASEDYMSLMHQAAMLSDMFKKHQYEIEDMFEDTNFQSWQGKYGQYREHREQEFERQWRERKRDQSC